jgi:hypothetical protein
LTLAFLSTLQTADQIWLQCFLGRDDVADRSSLGNSSNKPMPLVVSAKELVLYGRGVRPFRRLTHHQEQVPVCTLNIENFNIGIILCLNVEKLAAPVVTDV